MPETRINLNQIVIFLPWTWHVVTNVFDTISLSVSPGPFDIGIVAIDTMSWNISLM